MIVIRKSLRMSILPLYVHQPLGREQSFSFVREARRPGQLEPNRQPRLNFHLIIATELRRETVIDFAAVQRRRDQMFLVSLSPTERELVEQIMRDPFDQTGSWLR